MYRGSHMETDEESDSDDPMSCNEDSSSSSTGMGGGSAVVVVPPSSKRARLPWGSPGGNNNNPAASLVSSCPCGCNDDQQNHVVRYHQFDSPATSPNKGPQTTLLMATTGSSTKPPFPPNIDAPLDMSKTSPMFSSSKTVTPPATPPEVNDREKFRCLYLLVDAAVGQLEQEIAAGRRKPAQTANSQHQICA